MPESGAACIGAPFAVFAGVAHGTWRIAAPASDRKSSGSKKSASAASRCTERSSLFHQGSPVIVSEMTAQECRMHLAASRVGRLACVRDGMPYVVPISFVYEDGHIYSFSLIGHKVSAMRGHPQVCFEVDEIRSPAAGGASLPSVATKNSPKRAPGRMSATMHGRCCRKRAPTGGNLAARHLTPRTRWPVRLTSSSASTSRRSLAVVPSSDRPSLVMIAQAEHGQHSDLRLREFELARSHQFRTLAALRHSRELIADELHFSAWLGAMATWAATTSSV